MNNARRKEINAAIDQAEKLAILADTVKEAIAAFRESASDLSELISQIRDDEQEAFDNLPESLQSGEKGQDMEFAISALENAIECADADNIDNWEDWSTDYLISALDESKGV